MADEAPDRSCIQDYRYWRRLLPAPADIQDRKEMSLSRRLRGLKGMSWAAAAVLNICQTASRLSRLGRSVFFGADDGTQRADRSAPNSKIMYQYLRGERCPVEGPRGKYKVDLTGALHALPGGATARLWLHSLLWEVLDSTVTPEDLTRIRLRFESAPQERFLREYIELWIRYRDLTFTGGGDTDLQELAHAIDAWHDKLRKTDAVFNHIYEPLLRYLEIAEPRLPLARSYSSQLSCQAPTAFAASLWAAYERGNRYVDKRINRFESGVDRYLLSGAVRLPDHRFLAIFRAQWERRLRTEQAANSLDWYWKVKNGMPPRGHGWECLYEAWGINFPDTSPRTTRNRPPAQGRGQLPCAWQSSYQPTAIAHGRMSQTDLRHRCCPTPR
ncbi:hypothetical protein ACFQ3P_06855 [Paraburkholderia sabiae]|uniref:Uncharacterized protein n=1 Tax=Paraburkholderia sabiae TaxID=273251 RepID=A0ABU9QKA9_9BURK|nr:hypothetical protein [Paraburkholderia sabiae]WJZ76466.1 hypothetical protein QEN71_11915 [Paraburkholderia sabiae]CAD6560136.1 hypothetical protein LMG24235_06854 [Paraburkholderia sabiae]